MNLPTRTLGCFVAIALAGCTSKAPQGGEMPKPVVAYASPIEKEVTQYEYFTGRTEALNKVDVKARVSGYLIKIHFQPGDEVKKDDPLFEIDPDTYTAELAKAKADLAKAEAEGPITKANIAGAEARVVRTLAEYQRADRLVQTLALSKEDGEKAKADWLEAKAMLDGQKAKVDSDKAVIEAAKSALRTAELNLEYCSIKAPIAGRLGDKLVTEGNLISGGAGIPTLLTTIVSMDPIDVRFDADENTVLRIQDAVRAGQVPDSKLGTIPAELGLGIHQGGYPLRGLIEFVDNRVNPKTGTIELKAQFANKKPELGPRVLVPGMYGRIRVPIGKPKRAFVLPEAAVLSDQGTRYILIVGADDKAARLDVTPGVLTPDGMRVIESVRVPGETQSRPIRSDERVLVSGFQRVRPGMAVDPKLATR